jgi:Txe/YoeB family toxin of Txe-Axe toxin-antitoxin module
LWRRAERTEQWTRKDWAEQVKKLVNVINNHGLSARIPTIEQMRKEVEAWNRRRNREARKIDWRFTTADARIKLKRLYPKFE